MEAAVFDLDDRPIREVREVMTPHPAVVRLDADDTPDEHRRTALRRPSGAASHASRWAGEYKCPPPPASLLACELNYQPLSAVSGAPLRLRVENQPGCKMVEWIKTIGFVAGETRVGKGFGGENEDDEYFDLLANKY